MNLVSGLQQTALISGHLSDIASNGLSLYCTAAQFVDLREERRRKREIDEPDEIDERLSVLRLAELERLRELRLAQLREEAAIREQEPPRISPEELKVRLHLQEPYYRKIFFWA